MTNKEIILKHVKVIVGWQDLIKHKYSKYLGSFRYGDIVVFEGVKTIYIFSPNPLDDYKMAETGLTIEEYYSSPDYQKKHYRVKVKNSLYSASEVEKLYSMKILSEEQYKQIISEEAERKLNYFKKQKETVLNSLKYVESEIKKYEGNT